MLEFLSEVLLLENCDFHVRNISRNFLQGGGGIMVGFKEKGLPPLPPCHLPPAQAGPLLSCPPASSSCVPALPPSCQLPLVVQVTRCFLAPLLLAQTAPSASHAAALLSRCWLNCVLVLPPPTSSSHTMALPPAHHSLAQAPCSPSEWLFLPDELLADFMRTPVQNLSALNF